ncbi:sulfate ABC transporter permease [Microlunatus sp. Gsoil 973]|uniref:sulfate ABC transporter permease n=1 Tax=Microlunatus sp. Gsoil 973 TaxID=2672569 RepID=UPI001E5FD29B|nr:sulfate ABC transporter permease subunit [Microlunatus sp. Gsoil 973]
MVRTSTPTRWVLRLVAVGYLLFLVVLPLVMLIARTFDGGVSNLMDTLTDPEVIDGIRLTAIVALWAVAINLVFGVTISILLVRYDFPGKRLLSALIDLPLSVSPVVVGLALVLVYNGRNGWFGPFLEDHGLQVIFNSPGMIMATTFVALPLVIREVVPTLTEVGEDQEQAARSLGANWLQTLWRITLPSIKWAVVYGLVLSLARSVGEFGAVKVVSGNITGRTQTATLVVEAKYQGFEQPAAYAVAFLLVMVSIACLIGVAAVRPRER